MGTCSPPICVQTQTLGSPCCPPSQVVKKALLCPVFPVGWGAMQRDLQLLRGSPLAQPVGHAALDLKVVSSSPRWVWSLLEKQIKIAKSNKHGEAEDRAGGRD